MQLKRVEILKNHKRLRLGLAALIALLLSLIVYAERTGYWRKTMGEIKADTVVECAELEKGCAFKILGKPYTVKSDIPLEAGKPFTLVVLGEAETAKAFWRMTDMDMGPNNYQLIRGSDNQWQAQVTLPPCAHGGKKWQLHLELNTRAADINTLIRDDRPAMQHPM